MRSGNETTQPSVIATVKFMFILRVKCACYLKYSLCNGNHDADSHGTHAGVETAKNKFPTVGMLVDCLEDDVSHHIALKVGEVEPRVLWERERVCHCSPRRNIIHNLLWY